MSDEKKPPSRTADQYVLRFDDEGMRDRLHDEAKKNGRSLNAELNHRLRQSLQLDERILELVAENNELTLRLQQADIPVAELRHQLQAKHTELETLREAGLMLDRSLKSKEAVDALVFGILGSILDMLPAAKQKEPLPAVARQLVNSYKHKDGPGMARAFADLFAGDEAVVRSMHDLARELIEAPPPKKKRP